MYLAERSNVFHHFPLKLALGVAVLSSVSYQQDLALNSSLCPCVGKNRTRVNFRGKAKLNDVQSVTEIYEKMHMHISTYKE